MTFSGFQDEVIEAHVSPDTTAERHFLPKPALMAGKLLLADRGYPSRPYFEALDAAGAHLVVRLTRSWSPWVLASRGDAGRGLLPKPMRLAQFLAQHPGCALDLDIELRRGKRAFACRLVVLLGKDAHRSWLCIHQEGGDVRPRLRPDAPRHGHPAAHVSSGSRRGTRGSSSQRKASKPEARRGPRPPQARPRAARGSA